MKKTFLIIAMALSAVTMGWAKNYDLYVNYVQVTDNNKEDILNNGMFSFNPSTNTLTMHGGEIMCAYQSQSLGIIKGFIMAGEMSATAKLSQLNIYVEHATTIINDKKPSSSISWTSSTCWDGIYSTIPTTFIGQDELNLAGFFGHCVHVKNNLTFESGTYNFVSGMSTDANEDNLNYASHCIYQQNSNYKLYLKGGFFNLKTYSDLSTDRASVMRYDGGIDFSGIGRVDFISPETGNLEERTDDNKYFSDLFNNKRYLSDVWYVSVGNIRRRGIQKAELWPKKAPVTLADGTEWSELKNYYKKNDGTVQFCYSNGRGHLTFYNANLTLPMGLVTNLHCLTIFCKDKNIINYSGTGYALQLPASDNSLLFRGVERIASLTINAPACLQTNNGFTIENMTLDCQASGQQAITIASTSSKAIDHCIRVSLDNKAGDNPAKLHAKSTQWPIYGVKEVPEGTIFKMGKVLNDVIVDQKGNAMTDVTIGYEGTYPIAVDRYKLTDSRIEYYQELYGKSNFVYDENTQTLSIQNVNAPNMEIYFFKADQGTFTLAIQGTNTLKNIAVNQALTISRNGTLNVTNTDGEAINLLSSAKLAIADQATVNFAGSTYGVKSESADAIGSIAIKNATATFKGGTQSVKDIQSISASQSVLTAPANASFSYDLNTIVVGGTPTKEKVVYTRTDSSKPVFNIDAYIGQEDNIVADVKVGKIIKLTAKVTGNGSAAGEFRWQVYSEEDGWTWLTTKQSITKTELMNGKLITQETTIAQSDPSQKLMRAVVTNSDGTETAISNVITLNALYQIFLQDDGYKYYLNGDKASAQSVTIGGGDNVWMHTYDTLYLEVDEDARECFMDFESDEFNIFGGENYVYYTYDVTSGRIDITIRKLKIEYYSSRTQMDESTLVERILYTDSKPVYCGSTLKSSSHFSPAAPKKTSPFVGWMDMSNQVTYDRDALDSLELYENKVFCAIYEEDITHYYQLLVNEVQVSSENCDNILGDGSAYYDNGNKTLTLNNANISYNDGYVIYIMQNMAIECVGENTLSTTANNREALCGDGGRVTITGNGTLFAKSVNGRAILASNGLTIQGGSSITVESTNSNAIYLDDDSLTIDGATLIAKGNGKAATINGCNGLMMNNGVAIRSGHTYDKTSHKFLNSQSEEAKDDIIIGVGGTGMEQVAGGRLQVTGGSRKVLRDGQLIIIREGQTYTAQGTRL